METHFAALRVGEAGVQKVRGMCEPREETVKTRGAPAPRAPAISHTTVITQPDLLHAFIEPFLKGETPKGMSE